MALPHSFVDKGFKLLNFTHRNVLRMSRGRIGGSAFGMSAVELLTTGRRSGLTRSTMLTAPVIDGDRVVLVASKGGDDRDPDWLRNIIATPDVELIRAGTPCRMHARVANDAERDELWPRIVAAYKPYASYRRRTSRDIPVVICEPRL
jgi:deazaflavin-dependent oxidoreductase (nitroreductase family)